MNIGKGVKIVRKELGVSQGELSKLADISQSYLSQVESSKRNYTVDIINRLTTALKVPLIRIIYNSIEESDIGEQNMQLYKVVEPLLESITKRMIIVDTEKTL